MKKRVEKFLKLLLVASLIFSFLYMDAESGFNEVQAASYASDYRYWSQGGSDDAGMRSYGCWVVAQSKLIYETNIDRSSSFNPDTYYAWQKTYGYIDSGYYQTDGANAPVAYANQKGKNLNYLGYWNASDDQLWFNINAGYYTILKVTAPEGFTHYVMVANELSKQNGVLYCYDSFTNSGSANPQKLTRYSTRHGGYVYTANNPDVIVPTGVALNKTSLTFTEKGATSTLTATVSPSNATNKSVTWKSSNNSVAIVDGNGKVTAVGTGTATITVTTNSGGKTATCNVIVDIPVEKDGWYYCSTLPSYVSSTNYDIQYQNVYQKYAENSPGSGWVDTGVDKKEYTKVGTVYESDFPLATSDTVRLDHFYYYHWCGPNAGGHVNFYQVGNYVHYDAVGSDRVWEYASYTDGDDSRYTYYHLKWHDNSDAYCYGNSTCDGWEHAARSYYWYKRYAYQNYSVKTLNLYEKTSSWGTTKDSSAAKVNIRYRLKPTGVSLNKTSVTLTSKGETVALIETVNPSNAGCKDVTWKSSNTSVATVNSSGVVTAVGNGTATITVTTVSGNKSATCNVTVNIAPTGVTLDKTSATLTAKGESITLKATVTPSDAANKSVTWKSSNTSVATVDSNGKVTAVGNGSATITVTTSVGSKTATCNVIVNIAPTGVTLDKTSATLTSKGETVTLKATVAPSDAANKNVTWKSSNTSVATVDSNGKVTAVGNGTATITVTTAIGNKTATCNITVSIAPTGVTLDKTNATLTTKGETLTLKATVAPNEAANKSVTWKSSNTSVATVDSNGKVTAVGNGTATITVTTSVGSKTATCNITVQIEEKNGLVEENGTWYYYIDGKIATHYTGLVEHYGAWFYVENGILNWNYTGLTLYNGVWFYVQGGQLNWGYTGLVEHYGAWFYVEGGMLNWNYTGLAEYYGAWFYVQGGQLNWGYTGLVQHYDAWFYVEGGVLNWNYTGLVLYNDVWFYVEGGQLNWGYTGLVQHYDAWFYVEGGVLNWNYTGLVLYNGTWFYVQGGQLNWGYTGTVYYNGVWWYVENGILVGRA